MLAIGKKNNVAQCNVFATEGTEDTEVEIKCVRKLEDIFTAQVLSYLKSTGLKRALLINLVKENLLMELKDFLYNLVTSVLSVFSVASQKITFHGISNFRRG